MGRQGPCSHCGVKRTPHWRAGPPEKPVLCNACGSRWRTKGTLHNYIPRHANRKTQRYRLPSEMNPRLLARDDQKQEVGVQVSGQESSSACPEEEMNNIPSLGSAGSSSGNCMQMKETNEADKDPFWNPDNVPKRKRSELTQLILSPVERLQRQLQNNLQKPEFENIPDGDEDVTLIYARNKYIPPNEIGLGVMLLVSPTTTTERLTSLSPMAEDDASCSMNVPDSNLINNNVLDHVAMQNETTGNGGGKAIARENELAPHYMDTTSMVSGQKVYPQRDGEELGNPVKRQRGRPRLSTTQGKPRQG